MKDKSLSTNFRAGRSILFGMFLLVIFSMDRAYTQGTTDEGNRMIQTAVPMLRIAPESRGAAMGEIGTASSPDANSAYWNNAKYAVIEKSAGVSLSYSPWLWALQGKSLDMNLLYLAGYSKVGKRATVAAFLNYFSYGSIPFTDENGYTMGDHTPNEFATGATYSMQLTDKLSAGLSGKFIHSNLTDRALVDGVLTSPGNSVASDLGLYFKDNLDNASKPSEYALGLSISNLGAKMSYKDEQNRAFLPTNLSLGGRYTTKYDDYNKISLLMDLNKLLVPTPPIRDKDQNIISGREDNVGVFQGMIQSFFDAPGGFREEMQEIQVSVGAEYSYMDSFFGRAGYFYENPNKGGRNFVTLGLGLQYNSFALDMSYLITVSRKDHPLRNTLRFTLSLDIAGTPKTK